MFKGATDRAIVVVLWFALTIAAVRWFIADHVFVLIPGELT